MNKIITEKSEAKDGTAEKSRIEKGTMNGSYLKFALMMAISFVTMYAVMYLNVDNFDHIYLSLTRFYMTLLMVAPMSLVMIMFMSGMYQNKKLNISIIAAAVGIFIASLFCLRTQTFIGGRQYMKAMIPHHSSAILTSQEADLKDPEVQKLTKEIIEAQEREIVLMKRLLEKTD